MIRWVERHLHLIWRDEEWGKGREKEVILWEREKRLLLSRGGAASYGWACWLHQSRAHHPKQRMAPTLAMAGDCQPSRHMLAPAVWVSVVPSSKSCITKLSSRKGRQPVRGWWVGLASVVVSWWRDKAVLNILHGPLPFSRTTEPSP